jgi:hypothetical protein
VGKVPDPEVYDLNLSHKIAKEALLSLKVTAGYRSLYSVVIINNS